jgi:hypothetical protein
MLAFTSVYFFRTWFFNGLQPFGIKKSRSSFGSPGRLYESRQLVRPFPPFLGGQNKEGSIEERIARILFCRKEIGGDLVGAGP